MSTVVKDLGAVSAYAYAVEKGYTGTEAEFAELMADYAEVGQRAEDAADSALESKTAAQTAATTATNKATEATTAATTATTKAAEAQADADAAALDASQALSAASTATTKATEATTAAATATSAKTDAVAANTAAQSAKTAAQTAQTGAETAAASVAESAAQIQENADDIAQLMSEFSDLNEKIVSTYGKNRNTGNDSDGYLNTDGVLTPNSNWKTTDYCYVGDLEKITVSGTLISDNSRSVFDMFYACTYDSNKTFKANIGRVASPYTVGDGVAYIRFAYHPTYAKEVQVESGTVATAYAEYVDPSYSFPKSPYLDEYNIDYFNVYNPKNNIVGSYVNSSGAIASSNSAVRCKIAVSKGDVVSICRMTSGSYPVGTGRLDVCDASDNILVAVDMSQYATIKYGNQTAVKYEIVSDGAAYITFNVKMSNWDETNTTVVTLRDINTEYNGDYISKIEGYKLMPMDWKNGKWQGKKWVVVGDSLTNLNSRTSKYYYHYISDETAIDVYNMGDSGSGYAAEQDGGTAFYQRISNVPTDADVITIFGSFNDLGTELPFGTATDTGTTTIGGCMNATFDALNAVYPLAIFGVISPTPWVGANPTNEPNRGSQYCDLLKQICENRSIPYLDLFHSSLLRPWEASFRELAYSKDGGNGVHPDETGHRIIAPRIKAFLESLLM